MNLDILLKVLEALTPIIDLNIGAQALAMKQGLEALARDPVEANELNRMIAGGVNRLGNAE